MAKIKIGLLSFSDGRADVHESLRIHIELQAKRIKDALNSTGEVEVLEAACIVNGNKEAREYALELKKQLPDALMFNVPVFAFPNYSLIAYSMLKLPTVVISNVDGSLPGLGGLQAASHLLTQCGYECEKIWGDISDTETLGRCMSYFRAAYASNALTGKVFGLIGGRSIGMGSGSASPDQWLRVFGVDIDHTDQSEILRRAEAVDEACVEKAFEWLSKRTQIEYDENKLTADSLKNQIRHYYSTKDICEEKGYEFIGVKCHTELSAFYNTQCLAAAFFNDPYDWDGPKDTRVYTCEADAEGGLTMQIFKLLSGKPVVFADFRYYDEEEEVFFFCNCGAMSTWYAGRDNDPDINLKGVSLMPIIPKYAGKGCHVGYIASEGPMTLGRLSHDEHGFIFTVFTGEAKALSKETMNKSCPVWPHMFIKPDAPHKDILENFRCNHVHGVAGNYVEEVRRFCEIKGIRFELIE